VAKHERAQRKPVAMIGWGIVIAALIGVIVFGVIRMAHGRPSPASVTTTTTPSTTAQTTTPTTPTTTTSLTTDTGTPTITSPPSPGALPAPPPQVMLPMPTMIKLPPRV
jgi:hypothetical protein